MSTKMEIPTEQKINMSLEDLIKSKQQASHEKRNKNNKNSGEKIKKPAPAVKPNPATNTRNRRSNRVAAKQNTATNKTPASTQAAKVAKSVAASKANRAANINEKRGMPAPATTGGLKISFKPAELNKTTDRTVSQQIKAVLSRQSNSKASPRSVSTPASTGSGNNKRPKVRGKAVLKVQH